MKKKLTILSFVVIPFALFSQNSVYQWNTLNNTSKSIFETAFEKTQGITGIYSFYPELSYIGSGTVSMEPVGNPILGGGPRPTHFPIDGYRRAFTGLMTFLKKKPTPANPLGVDDDLYLYLKPNPGFKSYEDFLLTGKTCAKKIEGEIDINNAFWPSISANMPNLYSQVSIYGAWVHEKHDYFDSSPHDYLEVHPCENMWWSYLSRLGDLNYNICVFSDNWDKFSRWRPNPLNAVHGIAFEYISGGKQLNYKVDVLTSSHMIQSEFRNIGQNKLILKDNNDTIAVVEKPSGPNVYFSVEFSSVEKKLLANGKYSYKGFLKIFTAVKDGGHCIYRVTENNKNYQMINPVEVTVNLESITCILENDGDGISDPYGSYSIAPIPGENPWLPNYTNLPFPDLGTPTNFLWQRKKGNSIPLKEGQTAVINSQRKFILPLSGEFILYGDIYEDDANSGSDQMGQPKMQTIKVAELDGPEPKKFVHVYESGDTKFEVKLNVQREIINQEMAIIPGNIGLAPPSLYPDLMLSISNVSSSIQTNKQTGIRFKEYKFTCSITNTSNCNAQIDSVHSLTIKSYQVATCNFPTLGKAGGRKVATDIKMIKAGETIVVENQTANQPVNATTKIRVDLIYKAHETNLLNNKVCLSQ